MAKRIEKRQVSSRVKRYSSLLLGISVCLVSTPAFADEESGFAQAAESLSGNAPKASAVDTGELTYDQALDALMKTKAHSDAAAKWGEVRSVDVPQGVSPDAIIEKEVLKAPGIMGMEAGTPDASKVRQSAIKVDGPLSAAEKVAIPGAPQKAPTPGTQQIDENGWDWVGKQQAAETPAPTPKPKQTSGFTTVFDATQSGAPVPTPVSNREPQQPAAVAAEREEAAEETSAAGAGASEETAVEPQEEGPPKSAADIAKEAVNLYNAAVKLHLSGKLEEAITAYREALNANPELSQAHCNLGLIFNQQHDYAKAISEFRKALAIDPKDAITYNGIGAALRAQKDMEGAIKNWTTAVTIDPKLATAHYNLGTVYEMQKDYDKAMGSYSLAIKNDFRLGEAYYRTGLILLKKNRNEDAKEQFNKAIQVSKNAEFCEDARKRIAAIEHPSTR